MQVGRLSNLRLLFFSIRQLPGLVTVNLMCSFIAGQAHRPLLCTRQPTALLGYANVLCMVGWVSYSLFIFVWCIGWESSASGCTVEAILPCVDIELLFVLSVSL